jgi:parallel beta-helix repeat protein
MKKLKHIPFLLLVFTFSLCHGAVFTVSNTNDSGSGSLRSALMSANTSPSPPHSVVFQIPTSDPGFNSTTGVWTIRPLTVLPYITGSNIIIDGTTQTTFAGNTNVNGPEIELDGNHTTDFAFFVLNGSNITIKGFIIRRFTYGIQISGSTSQHHTISGNYIGVNHDASDTSGCYIGIEILAMAGNVMIGGTNTNDRNIVSGNHHIGIRLLHSSNNTLYNNYIGVDRTGTFALPNYDGLSLEAVTQHNIIGGSDPSMRNIISGNWAYGLPLIGLHTRHNIIKGNYIGTNAAGTAAIPNTYGILFDDGSRYNIVGGYNAGEGNVLSGNTAYGLFIYNLGTTENYIYGNYIGTNPNGTFAIPNGSGIVIDGVATRHIIDKNIISGNTQQGIVIHISGSNEHIITRNIIGADMTGNAPLGNGSDGIRIAEGGQYNIIGIAPDSGNIIAHNGGNGVLVMTAADFCNRISGNSIHSNTLLGIDLWPQGVTTNDVGDNDNGPNSNMNFPVIQASTYNTTTGETQISGILDTHFPEQCIIELFLSDSDPSGYGEGKKYVGSVVPESNGNFSYVFTTPLDVNSLTATATDSCGNTSEFSQNHILPPPNWIDNVEDNDYFSILPNPFTDKLYITNTLSKNTLLQVFSSCGSLMFYGSIQSGKTTINTSRWPAGVYFIIAGNEIHHLLKIHY